MVAPSTVTAVKHPAANMGDILKGSGFTLWVQRCVAFEMRAAGAYNEAAAIMRRGIMKQGRRFLRGADMVMTARRICRPLEIAADNHMAAARALTVSLALYHRSFGDGATERAKAGAFDPTK